MPCHCPTCQPPAAKVCCYCDEKPARGGDVFCSDACQRAHDEFRDEIKER